MRKPRNGNGFGKDKPKGYQPPRIKCSSCQQRRYVYKRVKGQPLCRKCADIPGHKCVRCRQIKIINSWEQDGPVCLDCYDRPYDICDICGEKGEIVVRNDRQTVCRKCYVPPAHKCSVCGDIKPLAQKEPPQCNTCYCRLRNRSNKKNKSR